MFKSSKKSSNELESLKLENENLKKKLAEVSSQTATGESVDPEVISSNEVYRSQSRYINGTYIQGLMPKSSVISNPVEQSRTLTLIISTPDNTEEFVILGSFSFSKWQEVKYPLLNELNEYLANKGLDKLLAEAPKEEQRPKEEQEKDFEEGNYPHTKIFKYDGFRFVLEEDYTIDQYIEKKMRSLVNTQF